MLRVGHVVGLTWIYALSTRSPFAHPCAPNDGLLDDHCFDPIHFDLGRFDEDHCDHYCDCSCYCDHSDPFDLDLFDLWDPFFVPVGYPCDLGIVRTFQSDDIHENSFLDHIGHLCSVHQDRHACHRVPFADYQGKHFDHTGYWFAIHVYDRLLQVLHPEVGLHAKVEGLVEAQVDLHPAFHEVEVTRARVEDGRDSDHHEDGLDILSDSFLFAAS